MLGTDSGDQFFGCDALSLRLEHDWRAVGVIGAHINAVVTAESLESYPDIGLHSL